MDGWITSLQGYFDGFRYIQGPINVYIEQGKIVEITNKSQNSSILDGQRYLLIPPLVDGHTHLIFGGNRFDELAMKLNGFTYNDILEKGGGIQSTVRNTRAASNENLKELVIHRLDTMLQYGTLTTEIKSGYGLTVEAEIKLLEILQSLEHQVEIVPTFGAAHVIPPEYTSDAYTSLIIDEMLPIVANRSLATSTDVFCDRGAFSVEDTIAIFDASTQYDLPVRVHAEELEYRGIGKLTSSKYRTYSADHLLHATYEDFKVLAKNDTVAMFMPLAPFGLFSEQLPQGYLESHVVIGLGSDFNPNNWAINLQSAIRMAVFRYRLTPLQAVTAATSGSYQGLFGSRMDPLTIGSPASFLLVEAQSLAEFVSKFGQNLVRYVIKNGEIILRNQHTIG